MSKKRFSKFKPIFAFFFQPPIILLGVGLLTYGVFIPLLNFFWDDLSIHWIADVYGSAGLARYFSTNRPIWGLFYRLNTSLIGHSPWLWQIFGLFWRWVAGTGLYFLLKQLFQDRKEPALWGALLFMVYPGFSQQYIAMVYGHFFLILSTFFYSLHFSMKALELEQTAKRRFLHLTLAILLSLINLFSMEYFFMLELLRPVMIWIKLRSESRFRLFKRTLLHWIPYLILFLAAGYWRAFIFNYQTENYDPKFLNALTTQPLSALGDFSLRILLDFKNTLLAPWVNAFSLPDPTTFGSMALLMVTIFSLLTLISLLVLSFFHLRKQQDSKSPFFIQGLVLAVLAFLLAGVPFWLTDLPVNLVFPYDRFTIPSMLAFSLLWVTLLFAVPIPAQIRRVLLVLLITFSSTYQLQTGIKYQRDWEQQSRFFWQLTWRAPSIQPGTILFAHELPITYFSDGTLTSALNWVYNPAPVSDQIAYVVYYPTLRVGGTIESLQPDQAVTHDLLVGRFHGNTSQSLALFYQPPACLRILDPELEADNWMVPLQVRETIHLTNTDNILESQQAYPSAFLYGSEPDHNWCYYFEKADLAAQSGDWETVVTLANAAFKLDDHPNDPAERIPFIEAFAHTANWAQAINLTKDSAQISPLTHPVLCRLWDRIERETQESAERTESIALIREQLSCSANP